MRLLLVALTSAALAAAASSQDLAAEVEGTWELTAAENVPYESELVFGRMTFDGGVLRSVFVFLDPDDAELEGRIHRDRYRVSDGQLLVRDAQSTTVLDVVREGTELTVRDLQSAVAFRMRESNPDLAFDPDLVGAWHGQFGKEMTTLTFSPNGEVVLLEADGDEDTDAYVVAGPYLLIDEAAFRYSFTRDGDDRHLVLENLGDRRTFSRVSR